MVLTAFGRVEQGDQEMDWLGQRIDRLNDPMHHWVDWWIVAAAAIQLLALLHDQRDCRRRSHRPSAHGGYHVDEHVMLCWSLIQTFRRDYNLDFWHPSWPPRAIPVRCPVISSLILIFTPTSDLSLTPPSWSWLDDPPYIACTREGNLCTELFFCNILHIIAHVS